MSSQQKLMNETGTQEYDIFVATPANQFNKNKQTQKGYQQSAGIVQ
jgi:hypothetical protein